MIMVRFCNTKKQNQAYEMKHIDFFYDLQYQKSPEVQQNT